MKYDGMSAHNDEAPDLIRGLVFWQRSRGKPGTALRDQKSNFTPCASGRSAE